MADKLEGKKVAILVENGFEQSELMEPRKALEQASDLHLDMAYEIAEEAESAESAKLAPPPPAAPAPAPAMAPPPAARSAAAPAPSPAPAPLRWLRIDIAPGLELNLREDFRFPADPLERQHLLDHLARQIDAATQG